ncbi:DDE-type integrase/transposase/recombinase [Marininema mesophilum]|uniref:DDE-type integrase/transposase/recombinase n=1 Tax=Marininema mesophilum TaxID=1048340 RepID=UPI002481CFFE|nr:DDE-type integrase/transposase/recombinase [Marininema mesophilum]
MKKKVTERVGHFFLASRRLYGSPKITKILRKEGLWVSQKTVARVMKENDYFLRTVMKYKPTTQSKHHSPVHRNVLNQTFIAHHPDEVWMADITFISTQEGWLYLASVMDLYTRKIVGWHVDHRMTKDLVLKALDCTYSDKA